MVYVTYCQMLSLYLIFKASNQCMAQLPV